jgi:hypothetical protein
MSGLSVFGFVAASSDDSVTVVGDDSAIATSDAGTGVGDTNIAPSGHALGDTGVIARTGDNINVGSENGNAVGIEETVIAVRSEFGDVGGN